MPRVRSEGGAGSVEYGLMALAVAAVVVVVLFALGGVTSELFSGSCSEIDNQTQLSPDC